MSAHDDLLRHNQIRSMICGYELFSTMKWRLREDRLKDLKRTALETCQTDGDELIEMWRMYSEHSEHAITKQLGCHNVFLTQEPPFFRIHEPTSHV